MSDESIGSESSILGRFECMVSTPEAADYHKTSINYCKNVLANLDMDRMTVWLTE